MRPIRRRRIILIGLILAAVAAATSAMVYGLSRNMSYLFTPSQVLTGRAGDFRSFRLGGMVVPGSIWRDPHSLLVKFTVTDGDHTMPVRYTGILPDLFRANQAVIATGHMHDGVFVANEVLAKHDATYMPRELQQAMAQAHAKYHVVLPGAENAP